MCGMAGFISSNTVIQDLTVLRNLLLLNTFRGEDSTGMFDGTADAKPQVKFVKTDMHPNYFLTNHFYETWENRWKKNLPTFAAIHCRAATQGKINKANSHPFKCGDILGMHNGTIGKTFINRDKFDTDSEAIFHNIATLGLEKALKAIQDADPAFALVWYDLKAKKLNFIRNSKRSLAFCSNYTDTYYWSSDPKHLEMGVAAASYSKSTPNTTMFPTAKLYSIDVTAAKPSFDIKDIEEAEEPTYNQYSFSNYNAAERGVAHWEGVGKTTEEVGNSAYSAYSNFDKKTKRWFTDYQLKNLKEARELEEKRKPVVIPNNVVNMTYNKEKKTYEKEPLNDDIPFAMAPTSGSDNQAKEYRLGPGFRSVATESAYKSKIKRGCACCGSGVTTHDTIFWMDLHEFLCLDCTEELVFAKDVHWMRQYSLCSEAVQLSLTKDYNDTMYPSINYAS